MDIICINTEDTFTPGQIVEGDCLVPDPNNDGSKWALVKIQVIREVTKQEYLDFIRLKQLWHLVRPNKLIGKNYYEIKIFD